MATNVEKLHDVLRRASLFLQENGREPALAEWLLLDCLGVSRTEMLTMLRESVPEAVAERFWNGIHQHVTSGVPLEHLTGKASFYGREFHVNRHTLIPRPETEELVEKVIRTVPRGPLTIADIGTGSGVIAVTLALELPRATVYATDVSQEALDMAGTNAIMLGADVRFLHGDYLAPLISNTIRPDIIVSNPPYVAEHAKPDLADTVKDFDPALALFAGDDGLDAYKAIIADVPKILRKPGHVFLEIGYEQSESVSTLLQQAMPDSAIHTIQDINQHNRIIHAAQ
ncbi:peptide chain release factor N(5)-glutamine methyltransferase [Lentibacillus halophilus]|uniref:Release factor glutamine methyltransferase n=1 Tax=Lentibacillus halophilus TaxID=295065 RepID=A0ABN0Z6N4_9BACI